MPLPSPKLHVVGTTTAKLIPPFQQRRDPRYFVSEPGLLSIEGLPDEVFAVLVLDVSKSGLRVSCSAKLWNGTRVRVKCRHMEVSGEVRYARSVGKEEFNLGISTDTVVSDAQFSNSANDLTLLFACESSDP
jgi:hypothetical protein